MYLNLSFDFRLLAMRPQSFKLYLNNVLLLSLLQQRNKQKKIRKPRRRFWVRDIFKNRPNQGAYHNLLSEMRLTDQQKYNNYLRMSSDKFNSLLQVLGPKITKLNCVREPIPPGERLALTLRYLASGDSMKSLSFAFRMAHNTISKIIKETCDSIWECLHETHLLAPTEKSWYNVAKQFEQKWQVSHCVGAMDGKHVVIQAPSNSGSTFYNYKGTFSIVLLAVCDANYKFLLVDIGCEGRHSDGGILKNSNFGKLLMSNNLNLPAPRQLGQLPDLINYYIAADEAFSLSNCIMRPYPGHYLPQVKRIFNYRLCRARRVIENAFGILAARWRIFRRPILATESTVVSIVKASVCLRNFLMNSEQVDYFTRNGIDQEDEKGDLINGYWRNKNNSNFLPITRTGSNMYSRNAEKMRESLSQYFMNERSVPFQWNK